MDVRHAYATEHVPLAEKVIHLHYFIGSCHTVSDPSDYSLLLLSGGGAEDVVVAEARPGSRPAATVPAAPPAPAFADC